MWGITMQKKIRFGIFIIDISFLFLMYFIIESTQPGVSSRSFLVYSLTLLFFYVSLRGYDTQRIGSPRWTMTSFSIALFLSLFLYSFIALFLNNHLHMDAWGNVLYFLILTNVFNPLCYRLVAGKKKERICLPDDTPDSIVEEFLMKENIFVQRTHTVE